MASCEERLSALILLNVSVSLSHGARSRYLRISFWGSSGRQNACCGEHDVNVLTRSSCACALSAGSGERGKGSGRGERRGSTSGPLMLGSQLSSSRRTIIANPSVGSQNAPGHAVALNLENESRLILAEGRMLQAGGAPGRAAFRSVVIDTDLSQSPLGSLAVSKCCSSLRARTWKVAAAKAWLSS